MSNVAPSSPTANNYCGNIPYKPCTLQTTTFIVISVALSLFLIGIGVAGYHLSIAAWGNYTLVALGVGGLTVTCIGSIWKICRSTEKKTPNPANQSLNDATPSQFVTFSERPTMQFLLTEEEAETQEVAFPNEMVAHIFSYLGGRVSDISNASLVCKQWYHLINSEYSATSRILNEAYGHGFPLQINEQISQLFPPDVLWKIPTISEVFDQHQSFMGWSSDYLIKLLPLFEKENASILKGQESRGRWFFIIRYHWKLGKYTDKVRRPSSPRQGDAVVFIFQEELGKKNWIVQGASSDASPKITPEHYLSLGAGVKDNRILDWIKRLINNEICGALTSSETLYECDKGIMTAHLWQPS